MRRVSSCWRERGGAVESCQEERRNGKKAKGEDKTRTRKRGAQRRRELSAGRRKRRRGLAHGKKRRKPPECPHGQSRHEERRVEGSRGSSAREREESRRIPSWYVRRKAQKMTESSTHGDIFFHLDLWCGRAGEHIRQSLCVRRLPGERKTKQKKPRRRRRKETGGHASSFLSSCLRVCLLVELESVSPG